MTTQIIDPRHFDQKARRIRVQVSTVLTKWGLIPRFKRWRLTLDPSSGMIVLFGILNNRYIAMNTSIPFSNYFDPRLLHDLANELQVQVVSCNSDGLRYAFILDRGSLENLPTHIDFPFLDGDRLLIRVIYDEKLMPDVSEPKIAPPLLITTSIVDDHTLVRKGVGALLKVFDDIKLREDAALQFCTQNLPHIVFIDEDKFNKRVAEHEVIRLRNKHIRELFR